MASIRPKPAAARRRAGKPASPIKLVNDYGLTKKQFGRDDRARARSALQAGAPRRGEDAVALARDE